MAEFELAITGTLKNEGGYEDDPSDPGGETNFGISKRSYPQVDIKNLTKEEASAIYLRDFWKFNGLANQMLANKVFDMYVNMGHQAIMILQRLLGGVGVDGVYGVQTETAANAANPFVLLMHYQSALVQHYRAIAASNPAEAKFLTGWIRRAEQ
jgi:lysozyme family protein